MPPLSATLSAASRREDPVMAQTRHGTVSWKHQEWVSGAVTTASFDL